LWLLLSLIAGGIIGAVVVRAMMPVSAALFEACGSLVPSKFCSIITSDAVFYYSFATFGLLPLALFLEHLLPAREQQPMLSVGLLHDACWAVAYPLLKISLYTGFGSLLASVYSSHLAFLKTDFLAGYPLPAQVFFVVVAADFLAWFHHLVRHKVAFLWEFHKVHHSTTQLNYFTDQRVHPVDVLAAQAIQFVPFYSLSLDTAVPTFVAWQLFTGWHTRFYHANIRTNLGPFRHLLVTPQSHRIHHSADPAHRDRNFGVIFSVWDWIFGTRHNAVDDYPATGIQDERFPLEKELKLRSFLLTPIRQLCYPILSITHRLGRRA